MSDADQRLRLHEVLVRQPPTSHLTYEQVARAERREDLGISSLNIILVLSNHLSELTDGTGVFLPEWVARLGEVSGITAVLQEIDDAAVAADGQLSRPTGSV